MAAAYEAWECEDGPMCFASAQRDAHLRDPSLKLVRKLFAFEAGTAEEALSIYHLRMGWEPYRPQGAPQPCPGCGGWYYPEGSGECWRCGKVC